MFSMVWPTISARDQPKTSSAAALKSIIRPVLSAVTIASSDAATVASNCLLEAESSVSRRDARNKSLSKINMRSAIKIINAIAIPPVRDNCVANWARRACALSAPIVTPKTAMLRTWGRTFFTRRCICTRARPVSGPGVSDILIAASANSFIFSMSVFAR